MLLLSSPSAALSAPAMAANCAKDYKDFWEGLDRQKFSKLSAEQIADLSRTALRGYDACTAGDERFTADNFFKKLEFASERKGVGHLQGRRFRARWVTQREEVSSPHRSNSHVGGAAIAASTWLQQIFLRSSPLTKSAVLGLVIFVSIGAAGSSAQEAIDCSTAYKSSLERLKQKEFSPARLAVLSRQALRIYDACRTDDMRQAKTLFENLDRTKD